MRSLLHLALICILGGAVMAEEPAVRVERLGETLFLLSTDKGEYTTNSLAFVGEDGLLLVDTQASEDAEAFKAAVDSLGYGLPCYIINTHRHVEHIGGNRLFGLNPVVITHERFPSKLQEGPALFDVHPPEVFPDLTVADSLSLYFNGERIRIIALAGSHDDNEIIVHFTGSGVAHLSSLVNGFNFPSVDSDGDVLRFSPLVSRALELLPADVLIVSGHNGTGTVQDLVAYRKMLDATRAVVEQALAAGKSAAVMQEEDILEGWESYARSYVSKDEWIEYLVEGLESERRPEDRARPTAFREIHQVWTEEGGPAAVALYRHLRETARHGYDFGDEDLLIVGLKLNQREEHVSAVAFLEAFLIDQPDSKYRYYTNYCLAVAHRALGNAEKALFFCREALAEQNDFAPAKSLLAELES